MNVKKNFDVDKLKEKAKDKKGKNMITNLIILLLVGILLAIFGSTLKNTSTFKLNNKANKDNTGVLEQKKDDEAKLNTEYKNEQTKMELKLKDTLENIEGVGKVKVMIYFKGGEERVPAFNVNDSTSLTEEKDTEGGTRKITQKNDGRTVVMMNTENGTEPLIVKEYNPEVTGVCVVAEGAENRLIKLQIHKAVVNLFSLSENKVNVYPMKK
ncbi:stage III sporulation protein AG [Clostridium ganghwense]|uniref:Stage III sporulation protein AG n=1 Tax=Clostridium ganghwense TaxID=312089 RepID=A0ABT4CPE3_9CLOT|nr:stage III sporulation protein AG [Clostridium ganghwense]MCY6370318.1 stage III sporulation protein AG [Clostridium ganghwense]